MTGKTAGDESLSLPEKIKKTKQGNHDGYTLPGCMMPWAGEPLYLVIARWCLQQNRWINRNDISDVFHMQKRRSSFQMTYISRKKTRIVCRTRSNPTLTGLLRQEIRVDHIYPVVPDKQENVLPRRRREAAGVAGPTSRRVGNGMSGNTALWERLLKRVREEQKDE